MPMAVLDGPDFSCWNLAGWLRRGRELRLGRHGDGLRLRRSASSGSRGQIWRSQRFGKKVGACRSDDHTAGSGQCNHQAERSFLLWRITGAGEFLFTMVHAGEGKPLPIGVKRPSCKAWPIVGRHTLSRRGCEQATEAKDEAVARVSAEVPKRLEEYVARRMREEHLNEWTVADSQRGTGSARLRAREIRSINEDVAPVVAGRSAHSAGIKAFR